MLGLGALTNAHQLGRNWTKNSPTRREEYKKLCKKRRRLTARRSESLVNLTPEDNPLPLDFFGEGL